MKHNMIIPKTIKVGQVERSGTYTNKLAYVIYYDEKGVLRKETSWNNWRDHKIEPLDLDNIPTEGFVLNKKAGGYMSHWNMRQTYVRVYDPRGFEFEISIENLLYILENTNSIKGKGLEGEFVYAWNGKDLVLLPCGAPDYKEISEFNSKLQNQVNLKGKDLVIGGTYLTKDNVELVYMGRFDYWGSNGSTFIESKGYYKTAFKNKGKHYYFNSIDGKSFIQLKTIGKKIIGVVSEECIFDYSERMERLESTVGYSVVDYEADVYEALTLEEFKKELNYASYRAKFHSLKEDQYVQLVVEKPHNTEKGKYSYNEKYQEPYKYWGEIQYRDAYRSTHVNTEEELFDIIKPHRLKRFLKNGRTFEGNWWY